MIARGLLNRISAVSYRGEGWRRIDRVVVGSAVAQVDFTKGIDGRFDLYKAVLSNLLPATDGDELYLRIFEGGSIQAGATAYEYVTDILQTSTSGWQTAGNSQGAAQMEIARNVGSGTGEGVDGIIYMARTDVTSNKRFWWDLVYSDNTGTSVGVRISGMGMFNNTQNAINGLRFLFSTGNIASGTIALYGLQK